MKKSSLFVKDDCDRGTTFVPEILALIAVNAGYGRFFRLLKGASHHMESFSRTYPKLAGDFHTMLLGFRIDLSHIIL